jgi:hypothetical protein
MSEENNRTYLPVLLGGLIGCAIGFVFLVISFLTAFSICSDTSIAEVLFPFSLSVDPALHDRALLALLLALIQYPLYGIILGVAWVRSRLDRSLVLACAMVMLVGHGVVVGIAKHRVKVMWEERFSHMQY